MPPVLLERLGKRSVGLAGREWGWGEDKDIADGEAEMMS